MARAWGKVRSDAIVEGSLDEREVSAAGSKLAARRRTRPVVSATSSCPTRIPRRGNVES